MNKLILRVSLWTFLAAFLAGALVYSFIAQHMDNTVNLGASKQERVVWAIPKGSNLSQVNKQLSVEGIISNPKVMSHRFVLRAPGSDWTDGTFKHRATIIAT